MLETGEAIAQRGVFDAEQMTDLPKALRQKLREEGLDGSLPVSAARGSMAESRSMTVAAMALPMPKLRIVRSSAVADCIGLSHPATSTPNRPANIST